MPFLGAKYSGGSKGLVVMKAWPIGPFFFFSLPMAS